MILTCLLIGLALSAGAAGPEDLASAHRFTRTATDALLAGDLERAETVLGQAIAVVERFPPARLALGHIALARGQFDLALQEYLWARQGYEELGPALFDVENERYREARASIAALEESFQGLQRKFAELEPTSRRAVEARREARALKLRIRQLEIVAPPVAGDSRPPAEVDCHLGNALFRLKQIEGAVEAWQACAARLPSFAPVYSNLAVALLELGRTDEARASLAEAQRLGMSVDPRLEARLLPEGE